MHILSNFVAWPPTCQPFRTTIRSTNASPTSHDPANHGLLPKNNGAAKVVFQNVRGTQRILLLLNMFPTLTSAHSPIFHSPKVLTGKLWLFDALSGNSICLVRLFCKFPIRKRKA